MLLNVVYLSALILMSPVLLWRAARFGRYRRGWRQKLWGDVPLRSVDRHRVWLHAVSVGEVNLLTELVEKFQRRHPEWDVVVSTTTDAGYDLACRRFGQQRVFFCPLDFSWAVRRALRRVRPQLLVLAELEVWPNLIRAAKDQAVPVAVINGRLSESSHRGYRRLRRWLRPTFARLDLVACQDSTYAARFLDCGVPATHVVVTGSVKYDGAAAARDSTDVLQCIELAGIEPWQRVWVAGSTQAGEERTMLDVYQVLSRFSPELRLIVVPRHPERFDEVQRLIESKGMVCRRRSQLPDHATNAWQNDSVLLIDSVGELKHWWGTAQIAFVGGSLGNRGGQNMLEPAGYGAAICFGPNTRNFHDIVARLLAAEGAVVVHDNVQLADFVARCLNDPMAADQLGSAARQVVLAHRGATERTLRALAGLMPAAAARNPTRRAA